MNMKKLYTHKKGWGGTTLYNPSGSALFLEGDDEHNFLKDVEFTEKVWVEGSAMTKAILIRNFESIDSHLSYIISKYF